MEKRHEEKESCASGREMHTGKWEPVWLTPGGLAFLHSGFVSLLGCPDKLVSLRYCDGLNPIHRPVEWRLSGVCNPLGFTSSHKMYTRNSIISYGEKYLHLGGESSKYRHKIKITGKSLYFKMTRVCIGTMFFSCGQKRVPPPRTPRSSCNCNRSPRGDFLTRAGLLMLP